MIKPKGGKWWGLWFAIFLTYEFWALGRDVSFTLSYNVWQLMDDSVVFRVGVPVGLAWLLWHFTVDWYRTRKYRK